MEKNNQNKLLKWSILFTLVAIIFVSFNINSAAAADSYKGVAVKDPTNVYSTASTSSAVHKSYKAGSVLQYTAHSSSWYSATVYVNGQKKNGYIHVSDVDNLTGEQQDLKGVALESPTAIKEGVHSGAKTLKSYDEGSVLRYRSFSANWYEATVYVSGKKKTGYIARDAVETSVSPQISLKGIGLKSSTAVYSNASTSSSVLKSYAEGTVLKYKTFSKNWFEAEVYVNGKKTTGYIHKDHVETSLQQQESLRGIGLQALTKIYSQASTGSAALKSYSAGTVLKYTTFSESWYEAKVYINGRAKYGYIPKSAVQDVLDEQRSMKGIGLKNRTAVYSLASTDSATLKTYNEGTVLSFKTFTTDWYEATVYVNGSKETGYIKSSHIEGVNETNETLKAVAMKSPTNVYTLASKNSKVLKSYGKTNQLKLETFSPNWFSATVYVNGKRVNGFVHNDDISKDQIITTVTPYSIDYKAVVDRQMKVAPQVSPKTGGGWMDASREQVEYYVNSSNFDKNSTEYYQFLVLSQPAGLNAKEVNEKILNNPNGTLIGKAQAFIDAGKKYNVNDAYLISHALLETGNGTSTLAKGVPVDETGKMVPASEAVHTVYNMYGIGAVDSCPIPCGAQEAFDRGWFTPEEAIIGGAAFVNEYVNDGQDTLYKMRWNPAAHATSSTATHQYATDIGWAAKQTSTIAKIYNSLDNFVLIFDVPKYANQPASSGDPNAYLEKEPAPQPSNIMPAGVYGQNSANLNLRPKPTTSSKAYFSIPKGAKFEIFEIDGNWYRTKYDGQSGWVHSDYVSFLNLLEVKTNGLNIRTEANTSKDAIAKVNAPELLAAVLDKDDKIIRNKEWYQITYQGKKAWVSGGSGGTAYIKVR